MTRLLVVTRAPWNDANAIGNTMTNLLQGWPAEDLANLSLQGGEATTGPYAHSFSLSEAAIIRRLQPRRLRRVPRSSNDHDPAEPGLAGSAESVLYGTFRGSGHLTSQVARELIWSSNLWHSEDLDSFLVDFAPAVVFMPAFGVIYPYRVLNHILDSTKSALALLHADDYLSRPRHPSGPVSRAYFEAVNSQIVRASNRADATYAISDAMASEYSDRLGQDVRVLNKCADFSGAAPTPPTRSGATIQFVYIGSIHEGRAETLAALGEAISRHNASATGRHARLSIYSQHSPSARQLGLMTIRNASQFRGKLPPEDVPAALAAADVTIHVESFTEPSRSLTRLSFSTKIVDLLRAGRPIFALGGAEAASINYLKENDAADVAHNVSEIPASVSRLVADDLHRKRLVRSAWALGRERHDFESVRGDLRATLMGIAR